jgi:hypothetical protein
MTLRVEVGEALVVEDVELDVLLVVDGLLVVVVGGALVVDDVVDNLLSMKSWTFLWMWTMLWRALSSMKL